MFRKLFKTAPESIRILRDNDREAQKNIRSNAKELKKGLRSTEKLLLTELDSTERTVRMIQGGEAFPAKEGKKN